MKKIGKTVPTTRGVALISTMILLALLIILVGAFTELYRNHYSLSRSSSNSQAALSACDSIYQYVHYRLEHDRGWGSIAFPADGASDHFTPELTIQAEPGSHRFKGRIESLDADFVATIDNNLVSGENVTGKSPPGTAYCHVVATCRGSTRTAEFLLSVAPLFDSSVLTRKGLLIDADSVKIKSEDSNRNFIRAEGDITVPGLLSPTAGVTQFLDKTGAADKRGMLWSKQDIYSFEGALPEKIDTDEELQKAVQNSGGRLVSKAESHFPIFDIDEDNLDIPADATIVSLASDPVASKGGRWTFVRRLANVSYSATYTDGGLGSDDDNGSGYVWADVLEFYADADTPPYTQPGDVPPTKIYRGSKRIEDVLATIPGSKKVGEWPLETKYDLDKSSIKVTNLDLLAYGPDLDLDAELVDADAKTYGDKGELRFDLTNQTVTVDKEATIDVDGPFSVTSEVDTVTYTLPKKLVKHKDGTEEWVDVAVSGTKDTPPPVLDLGYGADGSAKGGVKKATIIAKDDIAIKNGVTEGLGRLISKLGNIEIQPKGTESITVDPGSEGAALLVYAGKDVRLTNPNSTGDWNFNGVIYARNGITMDGGGSANATFRGTIVSLGENINFTNCKDITLLYSAGILDANIKALSDQRLQVETLYWKR